MNKKVALLFISAAITGLVSVISALEANASLAVTIGVIAGAFASGATFTSAMHTLKYDPEKIKTEN